MEERKQGLEHDNKIQDIHQKAEVAILDLQVRTAKLEEGKSKENPFIPLKHMMPEKFQGDASNTFTAPQVGRS